MTTPSPTPAASAQDDIDHEFTDEIVCPHCGFEHSDSWEWRGDYGDVDCEECGKPFEWSRDVSVSYSTKAKS